MKQELKELGGNNVLLNFQQEEIEKAKEIEEAMKFFSFLEK